MLSENTQQTVIAAKVAAELYHAQEITRSLSISSKNLRVLAKRIGESAAGLAVLATFYDECSRESISLADRVSIMTVETASKAVSEWRISLFEQHLVKACENIRTEKVPKIVAEHLTNRNQREQQSKERIARFNRELNDLLTEMQKNIRSIAVIAVNSKIEAPRTGEHSPVLLDMAQNVEEMITRILKHIDTALKYLSTNNNFI
jgi:hypothetical protein